MAKKKETTKEVKEKKVKAPVAKVKVATKAKPVKPAPAKTFKAVKPAKVVAVKKPTVVAKAKATVAKAEPKTIKKEKTLLQKYQHGKADTGSTEVQAIVFSEKIGNLASHLKKNHKDFDSKRGLLMMVGKRRRLLNYLRERDTKTYGKLVVDLKLRG